MNNLDRWGNAKITRSSQVNAQVKKLLANRARYDVVSKATGVPWDVLAVIHVREASGSFAGVLHNGQKIIGTGKKTTLVPKGRGPFSTWEEAAIDALMNCAPYLGKNKDWSLGNTLDLLEKYNGLGYQKKGLPSPYLWAGTDQYVKGKYVADSKFDANAVDKQLGVAPLLMQLRSKGNTSVATVDLYDGNVHEELKAVQTTLDEIGYPEVGTIDGRWGTRTAAAVLAFRLDNKLQTNNPKVDAEFLTTLALKPQRPIAAARANADLDVLRKDGDEAVKQTDQTDRMGKITVGVGTALGAKEILDKVGGMSDTIKSISETLNPLQNLIMDNLWIILIGGGAFIVWKTGLLNKIRLQKHQTGQDVSV